MQYLVIDCGKSSISLRYVHDPAWVYSESMAASNLQRLTSVFFEWIFGDQGELLGVQLCDVCEGDECYSLFEQNRNEYIELSCIPTIWFGKSRKGEIRHYQDWEGYVFRRSEPDGVTIALSTHMLSTEALNGLHRVVDGSEDSQEE